MKLGITLGDPGGIGPEIVAKSIRKLGIRPIVFGSGILFEKFFSDIDCEKKDVYNLKDIIVGCPDAENGRASYTYIQAALDFGIDALVTAPINKTSLHLAGVPFTGHTTMLKSLTKSERVSMAFYTERLKTILATVHHSYIKVPSLLTEATLQTALENGLLMMRLLNIKNPKIALAGLNPHAGEGGLFGDEEERILKPFVAKNPGLLTGPYPPDTLYYRAYNGEFDLVISLYHDQGLIPIKLIAFDEAVNVTLGLPFIRTSPDHGTAFEIAYQDKASITSFCAAVELCRKFI